MKFTPSPLALALSLLSPAVLAAQPLDLDTTVIRASGLDSQREQMTTPVEVLEGDELVSRRGATLGESLNHLPGVRSASFGAGVGQPVIRGQSGARVKVLSDGVSTLDAASISPDHALTVEPLLAERIEVLKGPATLLYGGGAIGGVVNVIDRRVPTYVPERGVELEAELRGSTVDNEGAGVFGLTAGAGNFAVRVEGTKRDGEAYRIPGSVSRQDGSWRDDDSFNLGGSFIGERGYLGLAYGEQNRQYGLLGHAHADCHLDDDEWHCGEHDDHDDEQDEHGVPYVDMRQKRWDLRGELSDPLPGFERARLRVGHNNYQHLEIEEGEVGTRFDNDATDVRLELTHAPLAGWRGVMGVQSLRRDFQALGEEAYVPPSLTRNHGVFLLEEYTAGAWRYEAGLRHEWQDVEADGQPSTDHRGTSFSLGTVWTFTPGHSLGLSFSRSQRLPTAEELYANGPHAATRTVELGNPGLDEETSHNLELTLRRFQGPITYSLSAYRNEVKDYIHAADTGHDLGEGYREIEYRQADAVLHGLEGELGFALSDVSTVSLFGDRVRGRLKDGGDLPRMPADRLGVRLNQQLSAALDGRLELYRAMRQDRLAEHESETAGYNMLAAGLNYRGALGEGDYLVYLKGDNLLNQKAREHTSFIKDDVLLPGRNLTLGVRLTY